VDFDASKAAFLCFPGHKGLLGPTGTGALCLAEGFEPEPLCRGGTGSQSDSECQPEFLPDRHESGTRNLAGIAGLLAAIRFMDGVGIQAIEAAESALVGRLAEGLAALPGLKLLGPEPGERRSPLVSFIVEGWTVSDLAMELDRRDIACRAGLHCAPAAHRSIGTFKSGGALRLSPGFFSSGAEIDATLAVMAEILG
jgi:selenocysteine lyase/cysteine desulfurase